jgi:hypothetical protein
MVPVRIEITGLNPQIIIIRLPAMSRSVMRRTLSTLLAST